MQEAQQGPFFDDAVGAVALGNVNIKKQTVFRLHVGEGESQANAQLRDELEFEKLTGMSASAPARRYLRALLNEDFTIRQLRKVWKRELTFSSSDGLQVAVPRKPYILLTLLAIGWFVTAVPMAILFILLKAGTPTALALFCGFAFFSGAFFWACVDLLLPYKTCVRLVPIVENINAGGGSRKDDE